MLTGVALVAMMCSILLPEGWQLVGFVVCWMVVLTGVWIEERRQRRL